MKNIRKKYLLISILPILILLYISITPIMTNKIGEEISLKGIVYPNIGSEIAYIEYDIGNITLDKTPEVFNKYKNDYEKLNEYFNKTMYVVLKENEGIYEVDYATFEKPSDNVIYLKGKGSYVTSEDIDKVSGESKNKAYLRVVYTLGESINNKYIKKNIKDELLNDKYVNPIPANIKVKVYKGYGLLKEVY